MNAVGHTLQTAILGEFMEDETAPQWLGDQQALDSGAGAALVDTQGDAHRCTEPRSYDVPRVRHRHFGGGMTWRGKGVLGKNTAR